MALSPNERKTSAFRSIEPKLPMRNNHRQNAKRYKLEAIPTARDRNVLDITPRMENQTEKKMENEMETRII